MQTCFALVTLEVSERVSKLCLCCSSGCQVYAGGLWEPWCEFTASLDAAKPSEPVSISIADSSGGSSSSSGSSKSKMAAGSSACSTNSSSGAAVHGRRYRLMALSEANTRALPTKGKVSCLTHGIKPQRFSSSWKNSYQPIS